MSIVVDSSAILALLYDEPGADRVKAAMPDARLSAVSAAEVLSKLYERGGSAAAVGGVARGLRANVDPFTLEHAEAVARMRPATRKLGLSLGDRACLALGESLSGVVLTADKAWVGAVDGVEVELIR